VTTALPSTPGSLGGPDHAGSAGWSEQDGVGPVVADIGAGLRRLEHGITGGVDGVARLAELTSLALAVDELLDRLDLQIDRLAEVGVPTSDPASEVGDLDRLADDLHQRFERCRSALMAVADDPSAAEVPEVSPPAPAPSAGPSASPMARLGTALTLMGAVLFAFVLFMLAVVPLVVSRSQRELAGRFASQLAVAEGLASGGADAGAGDQTAGSVESEFSPVPKLVGETLATSVRRLQDEQWDVKISVEPWDGCLPGQDRCTEAVPGLVLRTVPAAGQPLEPGQAVTVVVADTAPGAPVAGLRIPAIDLNWMVVSGTSPTDLGRGPGHLRTSPLPGEAGNAVVAGHRTLFGAPFRRLDDLVAGDEVVVTTLAGQFTYRVKENLVVTPGQPDVTGPTSANQLTLVTSEPAYSAAERRAVVAELEGRPVRAVTFSAGGQSVARGGVIGEEEALGTSRDTGAWAPVLLWTELLAAALAATIVLYRRWQRWPTWLVTTPVILALGFLCFSSIARLLPSTL
jgi:LPXTG-site transpeptidase (sortase) family protein